MDAWTGGLLLVLRLVLPGWAWTWQRDGGGDERGWPGGLNQAGRIVAAGLVLNLLPVLVLGAMGLWTPRADWGMWGLVVVGGLIRLVRTGGNAQAMISRLAGALAAAGLLAALALANPPRSEWLAGGWDPGIYVNQAVSIERHNGTRPVKDTVFADMSRAERELVSASEGRYREVFPGVPIRLEDGSLPVYFFPLTPVCGAWLHRLGGMGLLHRMPLLLALLGLLPAWALLAAFGLSRAARAVAMACWMLSPLWVYHQAIPSSEMLQLFLLCAGILFYLDAADRGSPRPVLAGLALFAGTVNRFDYPVFAGWFLVVAIAAGAMVRQPAWRRRAGFCLGALALGLCWDLIFAWVTLARLQEKDQALWVVLIPFGAGVLLIGALSAWSRPFHAPRPLARTVRTAGVLAGLGLGLAGLLAAGPLPVTSMIVAADQVPVAGGRMIGVLRLFPFHGSAWLLAAGAGMALMALNRRRETLRLRLALLALGGGMAALLLHGGIAAIYPWALRRVMVLWVPFMALAQAGLAVWALEKASLRQWGRMAAGLLLLAGALAQGAAISREAWAVEDYRGMTRLVDTLAEHIEPGDIVVADDPRWGTPLLLAVGRDVLNGKPLWETPDEGQREAYFAMLRRLQSVHPGRILWLTSTADGMGRYPFEHGTAVPLFEGVRFAYPTVIHSPRGSHFAVRDNERMLTLHAWTPGETAEPAEAAESD